MATNLRDRGYGSSMDNYNAHKRKVEERKEQEKTTGPVSTLRLPKVNSTASSRAASTSAPIQTQRFYDPNVTRATPGTGGGRGTPHITEQEFNRSTAMTRSYGNYSNYLNGIHVTGSGFADPDILFKNEPNLKNLETVQNQYDQALNVVSGDFEKKASDYERWYRTITNQYQPMSDAQKAQGDQLYADYMKSLDAYQKMSEAHMKASASNAGVYANVSSQRQKWYDSIRDEKDIDVEEKDLMSQLDLLEDQKYKVQSESSYAKTQTLHGITTAQGLETVMNSTDELDRLDRQIDEVKAQLELLDKERAYSRYFKWQELANNNMPVSARRMQGGAPSWLDKIISGTATEEEIMQAINEGNVNPSNIAEMLDDEKQTYRAIYQQYGPAKAKEYVDELERYGNIRDSLNTRRRMTDETKLRNWVQKGSPFGRQFAASVLTVLASPTKVLSYVGQGADYLFSGEMTKDADYNVFSYAPNAVTAQIGENITKWGEEHGSKWVQKWGEFGYQTALSIATFLYTTALTGGFGLSPETMFGVELYNQGYRTAEAVSAYKAFKTAETLSLGLMGTEAAADAVMQAKDRGLDDGQAFMLGSAAGAIEILTEKFSVENLLEGVGDRNRLLYFLKSMFTEGSEEVASDFSNMLVDSLVAKDKSEFNQSVKNYMKEYGVSKQEALKAVWTEQLRNVGLSGLGGAISGGFMGGGNIVRSNVSNLFNRSAITSPENVANIINRAQGLNEWSAGARSASALQGKLDAGERFTIREVLKARNAIETDRKTDPRYVKALIEAAEQFPDAKKQADKLQANLDNVKVEDVEKLEEAIDLERLVDPNREDLQSALKYGETADQKSEAYKLTKGVRDKIAAGEKLSLEEVSAAESAVNTAKATSAEGLKSTIESGLASDQNSPAYKSAQQLQSKLDNGTEITLAEVNEAKRAVRAAENAAYKSLDPNVVGKYLITENGRKALTDAATILKNSTSNTDVQRGNEILQAIKDGNLDAKAAGEVFLRSQKILENTEKQTARVLQPREVTADMDAYDRSAAKLGISEEEASHNKAIMQAFGVEGEYKSFENNNLSAYYDRSTGKVYINANAQNPGLALIAHEVTHSFENTAGYKKLANLVFRQSKDLNADLQRITQEYKDAGIDLDDDGARSELVSEFVEQHMFNDEKFIKDVVSTDRSLGQKILRTLDNLLAKLGNKDAQQRKLLRDARDLWAKALQQRKTSDKAKAKIAEKRSEAKKLALPTAEAKAAAVRKTEGPKGLSLSRANDGIQAGIRQAVLTAGIDISRDSSGKLVFKIGGESVNHVTEEHIRDSSAFGAMISLARDGVVDNEGNTILKGHITEDEANEQYQAVADLMNTVMTTQNPEMVWELAGSQMFAAVKSNSDGQYGTTVDFTTVCRKTQEMITAMSERMMAKKGGLTKAEVIELQKDLIEANLNVPCPVCYVFSRWAGVGTLLDNMYKFQQKYANMTDAELAEAIERLRARDKKADRARLRSDLRNPESAEFDEAYYDLVSTRERLRADNKALRKQLKAAEKNGIQADIDSLSKSIAFNNDSIKNLDKQIKDIENAADTAGKELVWLEKVRTKATYKAVPAEILFNMADGEAIESFMRDYPDSWNYRTTRGPAMGKAITPYSDMRLGDLFMSLKSNSAAAFAKGRGNVFSNPLGVKGKFNKKQMNEIVKAIARTRAQNLIGGQRFQSTSDFRYDYALDYIQTFFEAQALGSNMQTYTKIIEFGEMVAKIGGDVNLSVMPRNKGYEGGKLTYADGNYSGGTLIYSNVTGINFGAAKLLSEKYDSAQLILVGINDDHIRLALNDTTDTGGAHVGFVIPYHASGASIDTFIRELVKNLNEEFKRENYTDYSTVQTDTEKAGATTQQRRLRDLRKALLTGNRTILQKVMDENGNQAVDSNGDPKFTKKTVPWIPKRSERDFLRNLAKSKTDISSRTFEDLLETERRALQGDPEAIRDYESWSADLLWNLYKKMWTRNGAENGVRLNSSQAAAIMPHEYWDTNSTRDTAYLNNFIFRSYCYNLGLNPRFTGIDSKGNVVDFGDFSDCRGYWKTLIDRAMYDNNGNYRAQQPINMSRLEVGMIQEEEGRKAWGDAVVKKPDVAKAREVGKQYAISKSDTAYLKAVESGDMETAQRMVDEAAKKAGYEYKGYHHTENSFTVFDRNRARRSMDIQGFFFSADPDAESEYGSIRYDTYLKMESPYIVDSSEKMNAPPVKFGTEDYGVKVREWLQKNGYDSVIRKADFFGSAADEYIVFDPEQIKSADPITYDDSGKPIPLSERFNPENKDIRYAISKDATLNENLGYHAGDLGKAEYLKNQGRSRGTGHFGTGTYFVGTKEKVTEDSHYGKRPQHAVDFSDYNLYKVRNDRDGYRLHDALQVIDGGLDENFLKKAEAGEYSALRYTDVYDMAKKKFGENLYGDDYEKNMISVIADYANQNGIEIQSREEYLKDSGIDEEDADFYYLDYLKETVQKAVDEVNDEYSTVRKAIDNLEFSFHFDRPKIIRALNKVLEYQKATPRFSKSDSYATVFMKAMGYDGVDVRGTGLDNTGYGSVIYDVKKDTIRYAINKDATLKAPSVTETRKNERKPVAEFKAISARNWINKRIMDSFGIKTAKTETSKLIQKYADKAIAEGAVTDEDVSELFYELYDKGAIDVFPDEYSQTMRDLVTGGQIFADPSVKADFGDDWNSMRKRAFAAGLLITNTSPNESTKSRGIDMIYHEASEMAPGTFPPSVTDPRQQLERIVKAAEDGKKMKMSLGEYLVHMDKTEGQDMYEAAQKIMDRMAQDFRTFGEMAGLELKLRGRTGRAIAKERERFGEIREKHFTKVSEARQQERARFREAQRYQREQRQLRELQEKTMKQLKWMRKNQYRAPADLAADWADLVADMDMYAINVARETQYSKALGMTYGDAKAMYDELVQADNNFTPSAELDRVMTRLTSGHIGDMDIDALQDYYNALTSLRHEFYQRNNAILGDELAAFSDIYTDTKANMQAQKGKMRGIWDIDFMTPVNVLKKMVGWNQSSRWIDMVNDLERGERKIRDFTVRANRLLDDYKKKNAKWLATADGHGKNGQWIEVQVPVYDWVNGEAFATGKMQTVYMTPLQRVHLYLESKGHANMNHIAGGRTFADKGLYSQGKRSNAYAKGTTVSLDEATVKDILKDMSPEEMELAKILEKFYNEFSRPYINETSQKLWGYNKAMDGYYAPIISNRNFTHQELGIGDTTAKGVGNMKLRQPHAKNASVNISALEAFDRSVQQTARFYGMGTVERNWNMLLNWQSGGSSMRDVISNAWTGKENAVEYIENLIREMQGNTDQETPSRLDKLGNRLLSNYVGATFGANPGITLKQAASFPTFATVLEWKNMPSPTHIAKVETKAYENLINTYTSELAYRTMGYASPETAQLVNNPGLIQRNKAMNFLFGGGMIIAMDAATVKTGWAWAENYVDSHYNLEKGTQEQIDSGKSPYYKKVAEVFEDAVATTQPMYDIMHRAGIMRKSGTFTRAFTMFRTVPMQMYNSLRRSYGEFDAAKQQYQNDKTAANKTAMNKAANRAAASTAAIVVSNLALEAIEFLNALWKNRGKKYKDDDDELTVLSVAKEIGLKLIPDTAMVPVLKELTEMLEAKLLGRKWYGISLPGGEQLNDLVDTIGGSFESITDFINGAIDVQKNGEDLGLYFKRHGREYAGALKDTVEKLGKYLGGLPLENLEKYIMGAVQFSPELTQAVEDAFKNPAKNNLKGKTGKALEKGATDYFDIRGIKVSSDAAQAIGSLYEAGYGDAVPPAGPTKLKIMGSDVELSEAQTQEWERTWASKANINEMIASPEFQNADDATKEKLLKKLYDYARIETNKDITDNFWTTDDKWPDKVTEYVNSGHTLPEAIYGQVTGNLDKLLKGETPETIAAAEQAKAEKEAAEAKYETQSFTFKDQTLSWDELSGRQKKIVQAKDAVTSDPNADLSDIIGANNATKQLGYYQAAREAGISNETYIMALEAIDNADNGDGNYTQKNEVNVALGELVEEGKISEKDAGTIWKCIFPDGKKNPFPVGAIISRPMGLRLPKIG